MARKHINQMDIDFLPAAHGHGKHRRIGRSARWFSAQVNIWQTKQHSRPALQVPGARPEAGNPSCRIASPTAVRSIAGAPVHCCGACSNAARMQLGGRSAGKAQCKGNVKYALEGLRVNRRERQRALPRRSPQPAAVPPRAQQQDHL